MNDGLRRNHGFFTNSNFISFLTIDYRELDPWVAKENKGET